MLWFFMFWWSFDDHLATALNAPGLGTLPIWVPLLLSIAMGGNVYIPENNRS